MPDSSDILTALVAMSRRLGEPALEYAILGEGNTSAGLDHESFFVKASGACLNDIAADDFVRVRRAPVLAMLDGEPLSDEGVREGMMAARVDRSAPTRPSVETLFHAYLLSLPGVGFVGHTHPIPVNTLLCSRQGEETVRGRIFPDEIVCCGIAPVWVPYVDPGLPLSRAIRAAVESFVHEHDTAPRVILMQNHGLITLGRTAREVESAMAMFVKVARILVGTAALGGPNFLSPEHVRRIYTRPDEKYREKRIL